MSDKKIKETFIDPRGEEIIIYEQTWNVHISNGHPEIVSRYDDLKATIEDPDHIREGRNVQTEDLYIKKFVSDDVFVSTRHLNDETITIVTSSYSGTDRNSRGTIKWRK